MSYLFANGPVQMTIEKANYLAENGLGFSDLLRDIGTLDGTRDPDIIINWIRSITEKYGPCNCYGPGYHRWLFLDGDNEATLFLYEVSLELQINDDDMDMPVLNLAMYGMPHDPKYKNKPFSQSDKWNLKMPILTNFRGRGIAKIKELLWGDSSYDYDEMLPGLHIPRDCIRLPHNVHLQELKCFDETLSIYNSKEEDARVLAVYDADTGLYTVYAGNSLDEAMGDPYPVVIEPKSIGNEPHIAVVFSKLGLDLDKPIELDILETIEVKEEEWDIIYPRIFYNLNFYKVKFDGDICVAASNEYITFIWRGLYSHWSLLYFEMSCMYLGDKPQPIGGVYLRYRKEE